MTDESSPTRTWMPKTGWDIWFYQSPAAERPFRSGRLTSTRLLRSFSPDGRWVAFLSDESGRTEVYVQAFPESGREVAGLDRRCLT